MSEPIPESLRKLVASDGDALTLWVPERSWRLPVAQTISTALVFVSLFLMFVTLGIGLVAWLVWGPILAAIWYWVYREPTAHRIARIGPDGVQIVGRFGKRDPKPDRVLVTGDIGMQCAVWVGKRKILETDMTEGRDGWTPSGLTWLARRLASVLDVPLEDHRPLDQWSHWEHDPLYRSAVRFDRELEKNRREWPGLHQRAPVHLRADIDHHGMRIPVQAGMAPFVRPVTLDLTLETLSSGTQSVRLADVLRVGWFVRETDVGDRSVELQVLTRTQWIRLFRLEGESRVDEWAGGLNWLANGIVERAEDARARAPREQGEAAEVPAALRALTRGREPQ